ncbi:squamosa promoter-binding-like protein 7 isoform X2 [Impatiens glandulifera]|uniref:squamosa promoter-binding-like protein 7 isoform X2 n=1 Tax=Impatiens glandulifera TaxID=253017 RepID=UPI001FB17BE9|nr:squamosa promoter-binding-like protein 7 isoform X2 [Impatiens glandulifera]
MNTPPPSQPLNLSEMESIIDEPSLTNSLWDWNDLLDFNLDDQLNISIVSDILPQVNDQLPDDLPSNSQSAGSIDDPGRVRKRDPRLTCSNYLAGLIPCACPELDAKLDEEAAVLPGKKRARTSRQSQGLVRCQVPGCEVDISELKGYHKRHRVCLRCANASSVVLDGQNKRYCQQCGKFHILSDFDEGKRSCRRKLERHNNRRRRKSTDGKGAAERESQGTTASAEDANCDDENAKESTSLSGQTSEKEPLLDSDEGHVTIGSDPVSNNVQSNTVTTFQAQGDANAVEDKDEPKCLNSPSCLDTKSAYSSMCPTGRISFKLYDWNPAEFPRRLRHQIFQWLSSMPVELEGYIRPGCTILTIFIAMPKLMWFKILQDPILSLSNLIDVPSSMLGGRDGMLVYLDDMVFRISKDGMSFVQIKLEKQVPKLHYVHPTCFEAGQPMDFVACGSNLFQPKFRFNVSFAGKYMAHKYWFTPLYTCTQGHSDFDHQFVRIHIPHTQPNSFGPAFIEVENESGLSNFIPIVIASKEICSEMKKMEQVFETSETFKGSNLLATSCPSSDSCDASSAIRRASFSQFVADAAWLLKDPSLQDSEQTLASSQIVRFNGLLDFLLSQQPPILLERVLYNIQILLDSAKLNGVGTTISDNDMRLLQRNVDTAREILSLNHPHQYAGPVQYQEMETTKFEDSNGTTPLLNKEVVMSVNFVKEQHRKSCSSVLLTEKSFGSRPFVFLVAAAVVCFSICAVVLHPQKVGRIAVTIRRCLFENS